MGEARAVTRVGAILCVLVLASGASRGGDVSAPAASPGRLITYRDDALTVRLTEAAVGDVLADLGHQAGADIRGEVPSGRTVTAEFDAVPLPEALHRLLGGQNFALVYGEGGRLRTIKLLGAPQQAAGAAGPVAPPPAKPASVQSLLGLMASHPPVPIGGRLAQALGSSTATLGQVLEAGVHQEDPVLRSEAVRAALQAFEADPQLRSTFVSTLNGIDDAELATLLRGVAGAHAEETVLLIMSQSRGGDFRIKASGILQRLRTMPSGG